MKQLTSASFFSKKIITPFVAVLMVLAAVGGTLGVSHWVTASRSDVTVGEMYQEAVEDAMVAEEDEIFPLFPITHNSEMVTWNKAGNRILLLSWNRHPERYIEGKKMVLSDGEVWTFTDKEILKWYQENKEGVDDWDLRLEQLIGLPPDSEYTHVTAFWAKPEDVYRPACVTDITKTKMSVTLNKNVDETYKEWFDGNTIYSYYDSAYPWTRLGYTYDWAENGREYGLSEFLIKDGASVTIEFTKTTEDFLKWLK